MLSVTDSWMIWDTKTDRRAGSSSYLSKQQAEQRIEYFKRRQAKGGRPDIDPSGYEPRPDTRHEELDA